MWFPFIAAVMAGQGDVVTGTTDADIIAPHDQPALVRHEHPKPLMSVDFAEFADSKRFGERGARRWQIHGGYGLKPGDVRNQFALAGLGVSTFIIDDLSIDAELNALYIRQRGVDAAAGNVNLFFRWHFFVPQERTWSMYLDVGAGMMLSTDRAPADGSRFNFTPQAGGGLSFDLGNDTRLLTGLRWHHISNANLYANNPGRDSVFGYVGINFGF